MRLEVLGLVALCACTSVESGGAVPVPAGTAPTVDEVDEIDVTSSTPPATMPSRSTTTGSSTAPSASIRVGSAPTTTAPTPTSSGPPVVVAGDASSLAERTEPSDLEGCPDAPRAAVADKANQRYWLCVDGEPVGGEIPMTTASDSYGLPPIGTHPVFAKDRYASGIGGEPLDRFVAFYTTPRGNRIAFHEVVDQDPATVGDLAQRGASAGCFRVREEDSIRVWDFLQVGDPVVVISN